MRWWLYGVGAVALFILVILVGSWLDLYADASASVADAIDELVKRSTGDA